jgi:hypothetical protein
MFSILKQVLLHSDFHFREIENYLHIFDRAFVKLNHEVL